MKPMNRFFYLGVLIVVVLTMALPAQAHTQEEYDTWVAEWSEEVLADGALTMTALEALHDMNDRHPCLAAYCAPPAPKKVASTSTAAGSSKTYSAGVEQWRGLVEAYFPGEVDRALRIMNCESKGNPNAKNPNSSATGLFQIMASIWAPHFGVTASDLYDPETNIRLAAKIRASSGWGAWVCG